MSTAERAREIVKLEAVAKSIYWEMNAVMHDHDKNWRECDKKEIYRDCARAALVAASHFPDPR